MTCVCTNADLAVSLAGCAYTVCNITEILRLENYKDRTCRYPYTSSWCPIALLIFVGGIENDKSHQEQDMRLHIVLTPLVGLFILARIFIRIRVEHGLGLDDWAMIAAGTLYMGSVGIAFPITIMGYGQHTWYLLPDTITLSLKVCSIFFLCSLSLHRGFNKLTNTISFSTLLRCYTSWHSPLRNSHYSYSSAECFQTGQFKSQLL